MGNRMHEASIFTTAQVNETAAATETVFATLGGIIPEVASQVIKFSVTGRCTIGTNGTSIIFLLRRSSLTGAQVGNSVQVTGGVVAAAIVDFAVGWEDTQGEGNFTYVVTWRCPAETVLGNILDSEFRATWS